MIVNGFEESLDDWRIGYSRENRLVPENLGLKSGSMEKKNESERGGLRRSYIHYSKTSVRLILRFELTRSHLRSLGKPGKQWSLTD